MLLSYFSLHSNVIVVTTNSVYKSAVLTGFLQLETTSYITIFDKHMRSNLKYSAQY